MNYVNIKHTNKSEGSETVKYPAIYNRTNGLLFTMLDLYFRLGKEPLPKYDEPREVQLKWYLDKISEFHKSLRYEARGNKYRYSIDIKNSKHYVRGTLVVYSGSEVVISTPFMSLEEGIYSDLFKFEINLHSPKFYTRYVKNFYINIDNWTLEEEKLIYDTLLKYTHVRIALSTLFNDYIKSLREMISELKDDKISKKLMSELSFIELKYIWKYDNIKKYCDKLNQLYGTKDEELPSYVNTSEICSFISSYKKLGEFFAKHTPQSIATKYVGASLFDRWKHSITDIEIGILRYVVDKHGEELTDEFLKLWN